MSLERINLAVTKHCNLRCRMCDYPSGKFWISNLSIEQIKALISEAAELGAKTVELSGGEPMTRKDIYEIISFAASLNLKVFMATNGVLIGPEEVKKLLDAGLTLITFSLEGPEELNDSIRGAGNFKKTMQAINSFLGYREQIPELEVMVGIVLSKYNYKKIAEFSEYLLNEVGINSISINPFNASMLSEKNRKLREAEFKITSEMMPDLKKEIEKLVDLSSKRPGKMPAPNYLDRIPDYFLGKKLIPRNGCNIPQNFCGISSDGMVFTCWHSPSVGHLKKNCLKDIINSEVQEKFAKDAMNSKCAGCLSSCYFDMYSQT